MNKEMADEIGRGVAREFYGSLSGEMQVVGTCSRVILKPAT